MKRDTAGLAPYGLRPTYMVNGLIRVECACGFWFDTGSEATALDGFQAHRLRCRVAYGSRWMSRGEADE